jgi:plasmanylethanolamine desaturase
MARRMTPDPTTAGPPERWLLGRYDYPVSHRVFELIVVGTFGTLAALFARRVVAGLADGFTWSRPLTVVACVVAAYGVADLLSGLVHFGFDNFGSPDTPVIGQKFVRPFRDHHDDPAAMTHGDLVAVNGDNVFAALLLLAPVWYFVDVREHPHVGAFVLVLLGGIVATNQLHKWCHTPSVPPWVRAAQRRGLVLSPEHHAVHHRAPYRTHYCITWGRLDRAVGAVAALAAHRHQARDRRPLR